MSKSKRKQCKPTKVEQHGPLLYTQCGDNTIIRNAMSEDDYKEYITKLSRQYDNYKSNIDKLIEIIKNKISKVDPLMFLIFLRDMSLMASIGKISEIDYSFEDTSVMRALEYATSVMMSIEIVTEQHDANYDPTKEFHEILKNIIDLYQKVTLSVQTYAAKKIIEGESPDKINYVCEQILTSNVRGVRFQKYEIEHLNELLRPQNELIVATFGISLDDILNGLKKLQYSIIQGQIDVYTNVLKATESCLSRGITPENVPIAEQTSFHEWSNNAINANLNNVIIQTGWPESFVKSFSYGIGQAEFYIGEFGGWPNENMPCMFKPFIEIEGKYYCFNYYMLFDNFYRMLQKAIRAASSDSEQIWATNQKVASEILVADIFKKLLPGCSIYTDNYYSFNSIKNPLENDIIIQYDDVLIVVEVKAGSFTYTSALSDYEAHIKSIDALINKPASQCSRTIEYINSNEVTKFFDVEKKVKFQIERNKYSKIYSFCVTIDNFNEIAAKAEKVNAVNIENHTIVISVDDLRIYRDYFDNPLIFLHYIEQRSKSTEYKSIQFNDELDHLAAYIKNNLYYLNAEELEKVGNSKYEVYGYRQELEEYFITSIRPDSKPKPAINIPIWLKKIITAVSESEIKNRRTIVDGILDYDFKSRDNINTIIQQSVEKIKKGIISPLNICGANNAIIIFVYSSNKANIANERRYALTNVLLSNIEPYYTLSLSYDFDKQKFIAIDSNAYFKKDINDEELEELKQYGDELVLRRIEVAKYSGHKIGRNDKCPCGSGKKYKHCCLK